MAMMEVESVGGVVKAVATGMLLTGAVLAAPLAAANEYSEYAVTYSVEELKTQKGVEEVHARIVKAAKAYCPDYAESGSKWEMRECMNDVVSDLVAKVGHPQLTQLHEGDEGVAIATSAGAQGDRG